MECHGGNKSQSPSSSSAENISAATLSRDSGHNSGPPWHAAPLQDPPQQQGHFQPYSQIVGNGWQMRRTSETQAASNEGYTRAAAMLWPTTSLENLRPPQPPPDVSQVDSAYVALQRVDSRGFS